MYMRIRKVVFNLSIVTGSLSWLFALDLPLSLEGPQGPDIKRFKTDYLDIQFMSHDDMPPSFPLSLP
jgi:hypothetical protein